MIWSILIAAIPERYHVAHKLLLSLLEHQAVARMPDVELLYLLDNRRRSVGSKRNALLDAARGEYVAFIDDDDEVAPDYVQKIYKAIVTTRRATVVRNANNEMINGPADVVCFPQRATLVQHGIVHECTYSLEHWKRPPEQRRQLAPSEKPNVFNWSGPPAHTMVWRRETIEGVRFTDKIFGEDVDFVDAACAKAKREIQIGGNPLYFYIMNEATSATR